MDNDIIAKKSWLPRKLPGIIVTVLLVFIVYSTDSLRDTLHKLYNAIPPQKVRLTLVVKNEQNEAQVNQLLIFDNKDSLYTDNEGAINFDTRKGQHVSTVNYADSTHNDTFNLQSDSLISILMPVRGQDMVKGEAYEIKPEAPGVIRATPTKSKIIYGAQYFKVGNSLQFGNINVKFLRLDDANNAIYVNICYTVTNWVCKTELVSNTPVTRDNLVKFADDNYNYKLLLQKIDRVGTMNVLVAYVSMEQTPK